MPTGSSERLLALYAFLLTRERPADRETIRESIEAYRSTASEEAFERAFERDKAALRGLGLPLRTLLREDGPAYALDREGLWLPAVEFTTRQRLLLRLAARLWADPRHVREHAQALQRLGVDPGEGPADPVGVDADEPVTAATTVPRLGADEGLDVVLDALSRADSLAFDYRTGDSLDTEARRLRPWGLGRRFDHWYVHGWDPDRGQPRLFRLSRMSGARATPGRGKTAPEDLSMDAVLEGVARARGPVLRLVPAAEEGHVVRDWIEDARAVRRPPVPPGAPPAGTVAEGSAGVLRTPTSGRPEEQGSGVALEILDAAAFVRCLAELTRPWEISSGALSRGALEDLRTQSELLVGRRLQLQEALDAARAAGKRPVEEAAPRPRRRESVYQRFTRLADMIADLSAQGPAELGELAARYGTTRQQVMRDVRTLTEAGDVLEQGADLRVESRDDEVWLRLSEPEVHRVRLGPRQTLRLLLSLRLLAEVLPEHREELGQITASLSQTLPRTATGQQALSVKVEQDQSGRLNTLRDALTGGRAVRLLYRSRGQEEATPRLVLPERLEPAGRGWHLLGRDQADGGMRTYRVDAIQEVHDAGPAASTVPEAPIGQDSRAKADRAGEDAMPTAVLWAAASARGLVSGALSGERVGTLDLNAPWGTGELWRVPVRDPAALDRIQRRRGGELGVWHATSETLLHALGARGLCV